MKKRLFLVSTLLALAVFVAACAGQKTAVPVAESPETTEGSPSTPQTGAVEEMTSLVDALRAAGATVELGEPVQQAFFGVGGDILKVNGADVQIFEYDSPEAMEADAEQVSEDGGSIGLNMVTWVATPHFYKTGRIIVLYVGDDQAVLDLLEGALGSQFAGR